MGTMLLVSLGKEAGTACQLCGHVEHIISAIKHSVTSSWFFFSTHMQRCTDKHIKSNL